MIYLDNSATTKPYPEVLESFQQVSNKYYGNPSSVHSFRGRKAFENGKTASCSAITSV